MEELIRTWDGNFCCCAGVEGYTSEKGLSFEGVETRNHNVKVVDKVAFNAEHPHFEHFKFLHDKVNGRATAKATLSTTLTL